jgi:hypothetical protein
MSRMNAQIEETKRTEKLEKIKDECPVLKSSAFQMMNEQ